MYTNYFKKSIELYTSTLLLNLGAVKLKSETDEPFTYTSGNKGPIYVDNRIIISYPIYKKIIAGFFATIMEFDIKEEISCIMGGETAGMSFAEQLGDLLNKPYFYIRKRAKEHGISSRIVGDFNRLKGNAILVEDLITDGGSKIDFINEIRKSVKCNHCLVVFDREQGGKEKLSEIHVTLHSLTTLKATLKIGLEMNFINNETYNYILKYLKNPKDWTIAKGYKWFEAQ